MEYNHLYILNNFKLLGLIAMLSYLQVLVVLSTQLFSNSFKTSISLTRNLLRSQNDEITMSFARNSAKLVATATIAFQILGNNMVPPSFAEDAQSDISATSSTSPIPKVPLLTQKTSDLQQYVDVARGFRLLR